MLATTSSAERQESSVHGAPIYNAPVIEAQNITKRFGTVEVLKGITMQAKQSDVITIIGSSGSGKSTFLRCLNLLEIPNGGTLTYRGETLHFGARTSDRSPAIDSLKPGCANFSMPRQSSKRPCLGSIRKR